MDSRNILVVDDDDRLTFILRAHLVNAGFEVSICHSGGQALEHAQTHLPDVIILDIQLPEMDGLEVTRELRRRPATENIPIILLTARSGRDDIVLGLDAGAQDYVLKPFNVEELTARVRAMLKLSHAQREIDDLNNQLSDEVRHKTERLELLYSYVRELNQANGAEHIYDLVVATVQKSTGCQRVSIMLHDPTSGKLVCKRAAGIDPQVAEKVCVDTDTGIAGQVFTTGTTMVASMVETGRRDSRQYTSSSFLSTPLVSTYMVREGRRLGVLNATDKRDGTPFTAEETECLRSIADSAAIALHNEERRSGLTKSIRALLLTVGRLSEYRDEETGLHLERVRDYARLLAEALAENLKYKDVVTPTFVEDLHQAAPLHDVGKVGIPDEILNKPGSLTEREFQIMQTHTTIGRHTLLLAMEETGPVPLLQMCVDIAHCHHERYNGKGYPRGISGEEIPLAARIIALVDAYDAMTSQRCYKQALTHTKTVGIIREESGAHFDPHAVEAFLNVAEEFDRVRSAKADQIEHVAELVAAE